MSYTALYRRWRPQNFEALVGQETVKQALVNALEGGHIAHAYLFSGPRGTGKTSTARILAKALNCEQGPTSHPCGQCSNCQNITSGNSLDVLEIDAASNRGIDNIKELRDQIAFAPVDGRYKVYIIDEVHMLTNEAFNGLLKTLEEPPPNVVFILATTDAHKVPATIHSRCQRFDFHRVTVEEITEHLAMVAKNSDIVADREALRLLAIEAEGGLRDALGLLDQCAVLNPRLTVANVRDTLGIVGREALREMVLAMGRGDGAKTLELLHCLLEQGRDGMRILGELTDYFRAVLLFKNYPQDEEIYLVDDREALKAAAEAFTNGQIMEATEQIARGMGDIKRSLRPRIFLELTVLHICSLAKVAANEAVSSVVAPATVARTQEARVAVSPVRQDGGGRIPKASTAVKPELQAGAVSQEYPEADLPPEYDWPAGFETQWEQNLPPAEQAKPVQVPGGVFPGRMAVAQGNTGGAVVPKNSGKIAAGSSKVAVPEVQTGEVQSENAAAEEFSKTIPGLGVARKFWAEAVDYLNQQGKHSISSCAKNGKVVAFDGKEMIVLFPNAFMCKRMEKADYKKALDDAILAMQRMVISCKFVTEFNEKKENLPPPVQKALDVFGGRIVKEEE